MEEFRCFHNYSEIPVNTHSESAPSIRKRKHSSRNLEVCTESPSTLFTNFVLVLLLVVAVVVVVLLVVLVLVLLVVVLVLLLVVLVLLLVE